MMEHMLVDFLIGHPNNQEKACNQAIVFCSEEMLSARQVEDCGKTYQYWKNVQVALESLRA